MSFNPRLHAQSARALIDACGGLDEAVKACRLGKPSLSKAQSPHDKYYLPVDVIADLEAYCGDPVYSRALTQSVTVTADGADIKTQASALTLEVSQLAHDLNLALDDKTLSPNEQNELGQAIFVIKTDVARLDKTIKSTSGGCGHAT